MPRQSHSYRRHQNGQAIATFGGKTIYLGTFDSEHSKAEHRRLCAEYKLYGRIGTATDDRISINEIVARNDQYKCGVLVWYMPVMNADRLLGETGPVANARVYRIPCAARRSRFGVTTCLVP